MAKLTASMQRAYDRIRYAKPGSPDVFTAEPYYLSETWTDGEVSFTGNRVYGRFATGTLKALEQRGLIRVEEYGGGSLDCIEVLPQA